VKLDCSETGALFYPSPDLTLFSRSVSTTSINVSDFNIFMDDAPNLLDAFEQLNYIRKLTAGVGTFECGAIAVEAIFLGGKNIQ
jgi:hypothetical protein